jgi:hypothetical protein
MRAKSGKRRRKRLVSPVRDNPKCEAAAAGGELWEWRKKRESAGAREGRRRE